MHAAIAKLRAVERLNQARAEHGAAAIRIGIGIHAGKMMLGTIGEAKRMQSDLLSDAVNLTSRLESLTKTLNAHVIISSTLLQELSEPDQFKIRLLGKAHVKGRVTAAEIYEVFDADPPELVELKLSTKADLEAGIGAFYGQRFADAIEHLSRVLEVFPGDTITNLYLGRATRFATHGARAADLPLEA